MPLDTPRSVLLAAALGASAGIAGCHAGQASPQAPPPPRYAQAGMQAPPPPGAPPTTAGEAFRPAASRQDATALLFLAGSSLQQLVDFSVVDGMAVMEGDILLGPANQLPIRYGIPWPPATNVHAAVALANRSHLWPRSEMPYVIDPSAAGKASAIQWAVDHVSQTALKLRPRGPADRDFVIFRANPGNGCYSWLGRIGGGQEIEIGDCGRGSVVHEIMHAAGFYHEQSRGDRDEYVTIVWDEIVPDARSNFEKRDGRGMDIGPYDFGSILHYSTRAFSRTGRPTIIPRAPNVTIGQREGLSQGDRAALNELYGAGGGAAPAPTPQPPTQPGPPPAPTPAPSAGGFAGQYTSERGNVSCSQSGNTVNCQYPGGGLFCGVAGSALDCVWSGGGQGRAAFQRQASGVLAGTYGDLFSNTSRGAWNLVPAGGGAPPAAPQPPSAPPAPAPPPPAATVSLTGHYTSTRGLMTCTESGSLVACNFQEEGANGRLDCVKDASGTQLSCTWATFFPRPGSGRAALSRASAASRDLAGTWGHFMAASGGGSWEMRGR